MTPRLRLAVVIAVLTAFPAVADAPHVASGRTELPGGLGCSAILIEPDLFLTAAHCAWDTVSGKATRFFRTPDRPPVRGQRFPVKVGVLHPLYTLPGQGIRKMRFDVALVRLSRPVQAKFARPLRIGPAPVPGEALQLISWRSPGDPTPPPRPCTVIRGRPGIVTTTCEVKGGESGSGLVRMTPEGPELVAIINSKAGFDGLPISQGAILQDAMPSLRDALEKRELEIEDSG